MTTGYSGMAPPPPSYNQAGTGYSGIAPPPQSYNQVGGPTQNMYGQPAQPPGSYGQNMYGQPAQLPGSYGQNMYGQPPRPPGSYGVPMGGFGGFDSGFDSFDPVFPNAGGLDLKSKPTTVTCPHCTVNMETKTTSSISDNQWMLVGAICLIGLFFPCLWFGCCFIPLCMPSLKEVKHNCSNCDKHLGTYKQKF